MKGIENKKDFTIGFLLSMALCLTLFGAFLSVPIHKTVTLKANVFAISERYSGTSELQQHNVITNIGENRTGEFLNTNTTSAYGVLWISIGNATASASLTQLTTEYTRSLGTVNNWTNGGDFAYNLTHKFTFAETVNINAAGAHWSNAGDGNMYSVANYLGGAETYNSGENLTIIWVFTSDCN